MSKTIFVIGGNATLAQAVLPRLKQDYEVITAGRRDCDVFCDIDAEVTIPSHVDAVVNFAASFGGHSDEQITTAVQTNVLGVLKICEAAKAAGVEHVVTISSMFAALSESDPQYSIYGLTKRQGDELAAFYCARNDMPLTILRLPRIYGDSDVFAKGQPFLYQLIDKAQNGEDIVLYGAHDAQRAYMHTIDVAEILARAIDKRAQGVYTCLYQSEDTYSHIAATAQAVYDEGGAVSFLQEKPNTPDDVALYDGTLYEAIDYQPTVSIEDGIKRIKQYREQHNG